MLTFDPTTVPLEQIPGLITAPAARLVAAPSHSGQHPTPETDQMLSPDEAAEMLRRTRRWLARNARRLPFAVFTSERRFVCSRAGIIEWLSDRKTP